MVWWIALRSGRKRSSQNGSLRCIRAGDRWSPPLYKSGQSFSSRCLARHLPSLASNVAYCCFILLSFLSLHVFPCMLLFPSFACPALLCFLPSLSLSICNSPVNEIRFLVGLRLLYWLLASVGKSWALMCRPGCSLVECLDEHSWTIVHLRCRWHLACRHVVGLDIVIHTVGRRWQGEHLVPS